MLVKPFYRALSISNASSWQRNKLLASLLLIPLALLDVRFSLGGMIARISDVYLIFLFASFWLLDSAFRRHAFEVSFLFFPFIIYAAVILLLTDSSDGFQQLIQWMLVLMWPVCLSYSMRYSKQDFLVFMRASLFLCAVCVVMLHVSKGYLLGYKHMGDMKYTFGLLFLVSVMGVRVFPSFKSRIYLFFAFVFLIASMERKGILVGGGMAILYLMLLRSLTLRRLFPYLAAVVLVSCVLSGPFIYELIIKNNATYTYALDESEAFWHSNLHRLNLIGNGVDIFYQYPWFGVGADQLKSHMLNYYIDGGLALYTHNWYLDFLVEYGVVGAFVFFSIPIWALFKIRVIDNFDCICLVLGMYCLVIPVFMSNGTTSMLIWLTSVGFLLCLKYKYRIS